MVGPTGFEPATPSPPAKCATRLRYGPTYEKNYSVRRNSMGQANIRLRRADLKSHKSSIIGIDCLGTSIGESFSFVTVV